MTFDPRSPTTARYPTRDLLADLPWSARRRAIEARASRLLALEHERVHYRRRQPSMTPEEVRAAARQILVGLPRDPDEVVQARRDAVTAATTSTRNAAA